VSRVIHSIAIHLHEVYTEEKMGLRTYERHSILHRH
jgi:hypothetical protein